MECDEMECDEPDAYTITTRRRKVSHPARSG
jgi:hypothetical protein